MRLIKFDKIREEAPVVLNVVKDSGWCYAYGIISVVAIVPVLTFQAYELWKCRNEGWRKVSFHLMGLVALSGNGFWMVSDVFFHDYYRTYARWIFIGSLGLLATYVISAIIQKRDSKAAVNRTMMVSQQTKSIIFVHSKLGRLPHNPVRDYHHHVVVRHRRSNNQ